MLGDGCPQLQYLELEGCHLTTDVDISALLDTVCCKASTFGVPIRLQLHVYER